MARLPRVHLAGVPEHVIQRGNNKPLADNTAGQAKSSKPQLILF
ncbi:hypothetical protein [Arsukibacterium ikkense]|nr:hypothetical protein [Arsukibacterium ikkense]